MTPFDKLVADINLHGGLQKQAATGFYPVVCPFCRSERITGGFRFDSDQIAFNCFRASCGGSCGYTKDEPISRKFRELMDIIGVKIPVELKVKRNPIQLQIEKELEEALYEKHFYKEIDPPDNWRPLNNRDEGWIHYFTSRGCDPYEAYVFTGGSQKGLAAVPMYYYSKMIGYTVVNPQGKVRYLNYSEGNTHTMMINSGIIRNRVILVDGFIDAFCFPNTVGILGKSISKEQAYFLRGKEVILFPEKEGGERLFSQAKKYGWKVIIPPWDDVKDLNDCVVKYGKITTAKMIKESIIEDPVKAKVSFGLWANAKTGEKRVERRY